MINTNYNILNNQIDLEKSVIKAKENAFINTLNTLTTLKNSDTNSEDLNFENILNTPFEKIDENFKEEDREMARNLKLATMFSKDEILMQVMYDSVIKKDVNDGFNFLTNRYSDKSIYGKSNFGSSNIFDLLHKTITFNSDGTLKKEIGKDELDDILLSVHSFNFLDSFSKSYKNGYDKYKDNNRYSFLYNDGMIEYEKMINKYKDLESYQKSILKQF